MQLHARSTSSTVCTPLGIVIVSNDTPIFVSSAVLFRFIFTSFLAVKEQLLHYLSYVNSSFFASPAKKIKIKPSAFPCTPFCGGEVSRGGQFQKPRK
jgi:hypothetical protein